jgi:hypothetical protein
VRDSVCVQQRQWRRVPGHLYGCQSQGRRACTLPIVFSKLTPGACAVLSASALAAASSFNALPLSLAAAAAAAAAFCLLFLACAAAAICRSRTVDASERESSATVFLAGGIAARFLSLVDKRDGFVLPSKVNVQVEWPDSNARSMSVWSGIRYEEFGKSSVDLAALGRSRGS